MQHCFKKEVYRSCIDLQGANEEKTAIENPRGGMEAIWKNLALSSQFGAGQLTAILYHILESWNGVSTGVIALIREWGWCKYVKPIILKSSLRENCCYKIWTYGRTLDFTYDINETNWNLQVLLLLRMHNIPGGTVPATKPDLGSGLHSTVDELDPDFHCILLSLLAKSIPFSVVHHSPISQSVYFL